MQGDDNDETDGESEDGMYEADHQWGQKDRPSDVVLQAVASLRGEDPIDLPPLHDVVDPDALDSALTGSRPADDDFPLRITFQYGGYEVSLEGNGRTIITPSD